MSLLLDLGRVLGQLGDPRFLRVLAKALAVTVASLAAVFWAGVLLLGRLLPDHMALPWLGEVRFLDDLAFWAGTGLMLALSVVLMVPAAAAAVGFFLDDVAAAVEARAYPALPPVEPQTLGEQLRDSVGFLGLVVAANLAALAIYLLVPPLAPFIFWIVNGFLLGREYFGLVARRRLDAQAAADLGRRHFARIWIAGTAMAVPLSVPLLNLVVPILGVAVFTHQFHRLAEDA